MQTRCLGRRWHNADNSGANPWGTSSRGRLSKSIPRECTRLGIDLLVLGGGDEGKLSFRGSGTVGQQLRASAPCNVLVARRPNPDLCRDVLCGVDGSTHSVKAAQGAKELAAAFGWGLHLAHVVSAPAPRWPQRKPSQPKVPGVEFLTLHGPAVEGLRDASRGKGLIVVGSRGTTGGPSWSLGSVSERLAQTSPCSALLIKSTT